MPWSWLVPTALIWAVKSGLLKNPRVQLLLWWFGTFFVFLSLAETKRQLYMLPAFPAVALLIAPWLSTIGKVDPTRTQMLRGLPSEKPVHLYSIIVAVAFMCIGLIAIAASALFDTLTDEQNMQHLEYEAALSLRLPLVALGIVLIGTGAWIGAAWRQRDTRNELRRIGASYVLLYIVILGIVMPQLAPTKSYAAQGRWIRETIGPDATHIGMVYPRSWGFRKRGAFGFETGGVMVDLLVSTEQVEAFFARYPESLVLVQEKSIGLIFANDENQWRVRIQRELWAGKSLYLVVRDSSIE